MIDTVGRIFEQEIDDGVIHGATVLAGGIDGEKVRASWGWADTAHSRPMTPTTVIDVASVTKAIAGVTAFGAFAVVEVVLLGDAVEAGAGVLADAVENIRGDNGEDIGVCEAGLPAFAAWPVDRPLAVDHAVVFGVFVEIDFRGQEFLEGVGRVQVAAEAEVVASELFIDASPLVPVHAQARLEFRMAAHIAPGRFAHLEYGRMRLIESHGDGHAVELRNDGMP